MEENRKVLIRLLKDGHITDMEFQSLYDSLEKNPIVTINGSDNYHNFDYRIHSDGTSDNKGMKYRTWTS